MSVISGGDPFFFGDPAKRLFGCYHRPLSRGEREDSVVLCPPFAPECNVCHRAIRQLAIQLARSGLHVLRFDFLGCGDSSGDEELWSIDQWIADISTAVDELAKRSGVPRVALAGLGLGATLALLAAQQRSDVGNMVLWDPIVDGRTYFQDLRNRHAAALETLGRPGRKHYVSQPNEIQGYLLSSDFIATLQAIDLFPVVDKPAPSILFVESNEGGHAEKFQRHLQGNGVHLECRTFPNQNIWVQQADMPLVPVQIIKTIVTYLSQPSSRLHRSTRNE